MLEQDIEHAQISSEHCDVVNYPCVDSDVKEVLVETSLTIMIGFFAVGVFWNNKKSTRYT